MTETETRNYYTTIRNDSSFGGLIFESDFNGYTSMSSIAERIAQDLRFDEQCKKDFLNRKRNKEYKERRNK